MAEYTYRASNVAGAPESGSVSAPDKKTAMAMLSRRGLRVLELKSSAAAADLAPGVSTAQIKGGDEVALALFKKLYQLCKGGMPVADTLRSLAQRSLNPSMKALCRELYRSMSEGSTLSGALSAYPKLFEPSVVHLCEAGEATANLVPVFKNVIDYLEGKRTLRASILKAVVYPIVLCAMAFGVVLLFLFFLLPQIEALMSNLEGEVNLPVKILMLFGDAVMYGGPVFIVACLLALAGVYKWRGTESGRIACDRFLLRLPLAGGIMRNADLARVSNLVSTLFASGVNTTETLRLSEKTIKNTYMRLQFQQCRVAINDGAPVGQSFKKFSFLDDDDVDILSVGERTGSLVEGFSEIYAIHMEILEAKIKTATTALSVLALFSAVFIIGLVAVGIVSSVFSVSQSLI